MGSSQSSLKTDELTPLFTPDELAAYDISSSKKELYKNSIQLLLVKFQIEYKNLYDKRKEDVSNLIQSSINDKELQSIRNNINILIIIGSSFRNKKIKKSFEYYQKSAEDLDLALLIRHLFLNIFLIPNNQILITSTQNSDFSLINTDENLISSPNKNFKDIDDQYVDSDNYLYRLKNHREFLLGQNINLSQVNDYQFKFYLDENIQNIVLPFNIKIIKSKLPKNPNSNTFVFLLDHEHKQNGFGSLSYQFIVERLLEIECNHLIVFNDSHHSNSIIKIIKICEKFRDIFPDINNSTLESALFYFISNLNKIYSNDELILDNISDKLNEINSYEINDEIKERLKSLILKIEKPLLPKISDFILNLGNEYKSMFCVPQHFIQFSEKATIFASSDFDQISLTLPARRVKIASLDIPIIRVFGSIFSSIVLETFLYNLKEIKSLDTLCDHIHNKYVEYGQIYNQIIKEQNQRIEGQIFNTELPDDKEIEHFFSPKNYKKTHFYSKTNEFPKLNTIILNKEYWNVDITKVNSNEYNDVHFSIIQSYDHKILRKITLNQLSQIDIPDAQEIKKNNNSDTVNYLFNQFSDRYQTMFCERAKTIIKKTKSNLEDTKLLDIRKNISILIIVGTSFTFQTSKYFKGNYQKDAEDLNKALLIRHLFHYAFGIPKEQILITSTQMSDFKNNQFSNSSSESEQYNQASDFEYNIINMDAFMLYQRINLAQVRDFQYKFYFDENIKNIVKPFNKNSIKNNLCINDNSDIFVFFLDHGYSGGFDVIPFQFIIECFLEIKCKHFFRF